MEHFQMGSPSSQPTGFLNVDLDVYSRSDLTPFVDALSKKALVLYLGREGRVHSAHFELRTSPKDANAAIRGFAALLQSLPRVTRKLWNEATVRDFNIGIQSSSERQRHTTQLSAEAIQAASALKGQIVVTVYGSELASTKRHMPRVDRKT
jgi:hypothetical protein